MQLPASSVSAYEPKSQYMELCKAQSMDLYTISTATVSLYTQKTTHLTTFYQHPSQLLKKFSRHRWRDRQ